MTGRSMRRSMQAKTVDIPWNRRSAFCIRAPFFLEKWLSHTDIDRVPFLPWDCLLPICSTYTKCSTQEVLQPLNKAARVKYWILPSVCDSFLWSLLFFKSILISILIDHYPVSPLRWTPLDALIPSHTTWGKKNVPQQCCKLLSKAPTPPETPTPHWGPTPEIPIPFLDPNPFQAQPPSWAP